MLSGMDGHLHVHKGGQMERNWKVSLYSLFINNQKWYQYKDKNIFNVLIVNSFSLPLPHLSSTYFMLLHIYNILKD